MHGLPLHLLPPEVGLQSLHGPARNLILDRDVGLVEEGDLLHFLLVALGPKIEDALGPSLEQVAGDVAMMDLIPSLLLPPLQGASHLAPGVLTSKKLDSCVCDELDAPHLVEAQPGLRVAHGLAQQPEADSPRIAVGPQFEHLPLLGRVNPADQGLVCRAPVTHERGIEPERTVDSAPGASLRLSD